MFSVRCDSEKFCCDGRPTATARLLETVEMPVAVSVARTRTGVGTVPELMRTMTLPLTSVRLVTGTPAPSRVRPPASDVASSTTSWLGTPRPLASRTWNVTFEFSAKPEPRR